MLVAFLDYYRETMLLKLDGLTEEQARRKPAPSANSLLGLVKHLVYVEHWWFHVCFLDGSPLLPWDDALGDDQDFLVADGDTIASVGQAYREMWERSNAIARAGSLDDVVKHPAREKLGNTLRWILVHMIEETARHAGHADITRELIDGATGD